MGQRGKSFGNSRTGRSKRTCVNVCSLAAASGALLFVSGCIIVPIPSMTPCHESGVIYEATLKSLKGGSRERVKDRLGTPDYAGPRGSSSLMVYQGEEHYSTDVFFAVAAGYTAAGGTIEGDCATRKVLHCYVLELDADSTVRDYDIISGSVSGTTSPDSDEHVVDPITDCSEAVWQPHERAAVLTRADLERNDKIADLEPRALAGDVEAAIELNALSGNSAPLLALARAGDGTAAYALYEQLSQQPAAMENAWRWLCAAAAGGNPEARSELGHWQRTSVWEHSGDDRLDAVRNLGIEPDDRVAYVWYTLAAAAGDPRAESLRGYVADDMTVDQVREAEEMAGDWQPEDCPSPAHRLSPAGDT